MPEIRQAELGVDPRAVGRRAHHLGQRDRVPGVPHLLQHRADEDLLAELTPQVRRGVRVRLAVDDLGVGPRPHVGQRLGPVEDVGTGVVDLEAGLAVERRMREVDRHAAHRVDHAGEGHEVHLDVVLDRDTEVLGDGLDQVRRPGVVGGVDASVLAGGRIDDPQVSWDRHHGGGAAIDAQHDDRVGALALGIADGAGVVRGGVDAVPAVRSDDQVVHGRAGGRGQRVAQIDPIEVVDLPVRPADRPDDRQEDQQRQIQVEPAQLRPEPLELGSRHSGRTTPRAPGAARARTVGSAGSARRWPRRRGCGAARCIGSCGPGCVGATRRRARAGGDRSCWRSPRRGRCSTRHRAGGSRTPGGPGRGRTDVVLPRRAGRRDPRRNRHGARRLIRHLHQLGAVSRPGVRHDASAGCRFVGRELRGRGRGLGPAGVVAVQALQALPGLFGRLGDGRAARIRHLGRSAHSCTSFSTGPILLHRRGRGPDPRPRSSDAGGGPLGPSSTSIAH